MIKQCKRQLYPVDLKKIHEQIPFSRCPLADSRIRGRDMITKEKMRIFAACRKYSADFLGSKKGILMRTHVSVSVGRVEHGGAQGLQPVRHVGGPWHVGYVPQGVHHRLPAHVVLQVEADPRFCAANTSARWLVAHWTVGLPKRHPPHSPLPMGQTDPDLGDWGTCLYVL